MDLCFSTLDAVGFCLNEDVAPVDLGEACGSAFLAGSWGVEAAAPQTIF